MLSLEVLQFGSFMVQTDPGQDFNPLLTLITKHHLKGNSVRQGQVDFLDILWNLSQDTVACSGALFL